MNNELMKQGKLVAGIPQIEEENIFMTKVKEMKVGDTICFPFAAAGLVHPTKVWGGLMGAAKSVHGIHLEKTRRGELVYFKRINAESKVKTQPELPLKVEGEERYDNAFLYKKVDGGIIVTKFLQHHYLNAVCSYLHENPLLEGQTLLIRRSALKGNGQKSQLIRTLRDERYRTDTYLFAYAGTKYIRSYGPQLKERILVKDPAIHKQFKKGKVDAGEILKAMDKIPSPPPLTPEEQALINPQPQQSQIQ